MDSAEYLLRCVRYIDLNPVRARMTDDPVRFPWSSCAALCGQRDDPLLTLHHTQLAMGTSNKDRSHACRELLTETLDNENFAAIRAYLQQQRAYGRDDFPGDGRSQDAALCDSAAGPSGTAKAG